MNNTTSGFRLLTAAVLLIGTAFVAGCGTPDRVTKTTTTEETSTTTPPPFTSSTTTTTTRQSQP